MGRVAGTALPATRVTHPRGVVTACDAGYFPGLLSMHDSVQRSMPCPVVAYDVGLTDEQREQANTIPELSVLPLPADELIARIQVATASDPPMRKPGKRLWPLWICPVLIQHAPFDDVFWLDCDLLVLRHLDQLFAALATGPVFTPENKAPEGTPNDPRLYDLEPVGRDFDVRVPAINAGVSGWRKSRDDEALAAYRYLVERAVAVPRLRELIAWHDQGCLIWAIQKSGFEHRVADTDAWNRCVINTPIVEGRADPTVSFLCWVRRLVPDAAIVHWNGSEPPWAKPPSVPG